MGQFQQSTCPTVCLWQESTQQRSTSIAHILPIPAHCAGQAIAGCIVGSCTRPSSVVGRGAAGEGGAYQNCAGWNRDVVAVHFVAVGSVAEELRSIDGGECSAKAFSAYCFCTCCYVACCYVACCCFFCCCSVYGFTLAFECAADSCHTKPVGFCSALLISLQVVAFMIQSFMIQCFTDNQISARWNLGTPV